MIVSHATSPITTAVTRPRATVTGTSVPTGPQTYALAYSTKSEQLNCTTTASYDYEADNNGWTLTGATRVASPAPGHGAMSLHFNNVDSSIWGQLIGLATFVPLGFLTGWIAAKVLKMLNLLRVPPEVELHGLDAAEYRADIHVPEFEWGEDLVIEPDGATRTPAAKVQAEEFKSVIRG